MILIVGYSAGVLGVGWEFRSRLNSIGGYFVGGSSALIFNGGLLE